MQRFRDKSLNSIYSAGRLAGEAQKYSSKIRLLHAGPEIDVKSIVEILTLNVQQGDSLELWAVGEDAPQAQALLSYLLEIETEYR